MLLHSGFSALKLHGVLPVPSVMVSINGTVIIIATIISVCQASTLLAEAFSLTADRPTWTCICRKRLISPSLHSTRVKKGEVSGCRSNYHGLSRLLAVLYFLPSLQIRVPSANIVVRLSPLKIYVICRRIQLPRLIRKYDGLPTHYNHSTSTNATKCI